MEIRHFRGILEDNSRCALGGKTFGTVLIMFMHDMTDKKNPFTLDDVTFLEKCGTATSFWKAGLS